MKKTIICLGFILGCFHLLRWIIDLGALTYILRLGYFYDFYTDMTNYGAPRIENLGVSRTPAIILNYFFTYLYIIVLITLLYSTSCIFIKRRELKNYSIYFNISFLTSLLLILFQIVVYLI